MSDEEELLSKVRDLDPYKFEEFVATLWELQGWETEITPRSGDRGVDLIAKQSFPFEIDIHIQAKRYGENTKVHREDIGDYAKLTLRRDINIAGVVTSGWFTEPAREEAEDYNEIKLVNGETLVELIQELNAEEVLDDYLKGNERTKVMSGESEHVVSGETANDRTHELEFIEGVGSIHADKLTDAGIMTIEDLASADPEDMATRTDFSEETLERWISEAASVQDEEIDVVRGIGSARAKQLAENGFETVADLATADPEDVAAETDLSREQAKKLQTEATNWKGISVDDIRGISSKRSEQLREAGIHTVWELAMADPEKVASETGLSEGNLKKWIGEAAYRKGKPEIVAEMIPQDEEKDPQAISGIGKERAKQLAQADIRTVGDLAIADPEKVADRSNFTESQIEKWGQRARYQPR